ncbi:tripartite tricarboxylate transporter substrate binding protein [Aquabacter sp. CN5-332]|uniref:Bug family tripartite tricarboxylate transporter substrate binding protein n=1 Tax=Aquabacter sp. CN5-332 TaxID=3156608 RepID=UPI0032B354CD
MSHVIGRCSLIASAFAALVLLAGAPALAAGFPDRTVTIIVPFTAGGGLDTIARMVGEQLNKAWQQPVVVENLPGANGLIATSRVARSTPDGYTFMIAGAGEVAVNPTLMKGKLTYDPVDGLTPLAFAARIPNVVVVSKDRKIASFQDFLAYAKANPGKVTYATGGVGNTQHLAGGLISEKLGVSLLPIPYKGAAQQVTDVIGGHVDATLASYAVVQPFISEGRLVPLAVSSAERLPALPNVPAIAETPGLAGFDVINWFGFLAPGGTPEPIVNALHDALTKALENPAVQERMKSLGAYYVRMTPTEFKAFIKEETAKFADIVQKSGITVE